MGSPLKVQELRSGKMSKSSNQDDYETQTRCRNTPLSRQPEEIVEIRYADGKAD
jgi:hypothetical protein